MELVFLVLLLALMAFSLASGFPVAFSLPGAAILSIGAAALCGYLFAGDSGAYFAYGQPLQWLTAGVTNFRGIYWEVERDTLIAIPLFVFMGIMLQRSKIAEDLLITMAQLFGPIPGGLGISVVFVGALLAATTGIVGATVVAMGLISLPVMMRNNYSGALATGTIAASGTLGQIIPPSIVLIILADQLAGAVDQASAARKALYMENTGQMMPSEFEPISTSAGDMFMGAFVPGLVLVGFYMVFILLLAIFKPTLAPAIPYEGRFDLQFAKRALLILIPPLALIIAVLGSIIFGIATVNQAGAIGAVGVLIMAGARLYKDRRDAYWPGSLAVISVAVMVVLTVVMPINIKNIHSSSDWMAVILAVMAAVGFLIALLWSIVRTLRFENTLYAVMLETAKTSSLVFIILLGAAMLTAAFRGFGGEELVKEFLTGLPGGFWFQFAIVMVVIFLLGFFLDFIEIAVVVVPIVAPILLTDPSANVTAVWLGVMVGLNIQTSFLTPPFGFALFYLRGVAEASIKTIQMYKGVVAFIVIQLLVLVIVAINPSLVNYLPNRVVLTSDTAPPPLNPRLQYCLEEQLFPQYASQQTELQAAIATVARLDLSYLPAALEHQTEAAIAKAANNFSLVNTAMQAAIASNQASVDHRPLHQQIRSLERRARIVAAKSEALQDQHQRRLRTTGADAQEIADFQRRIDALTTQQDALLAQIPDDWIERHQRFVHIQQLERHARQTYRNNADGAYVPVANLVAMIVAADRLAALLPELERLRVYVATHEPQQSINVISDFSNRFKGIEGVRELRKKLIKARRVVKSKKPDVTMALTHLQQAQAILKRELVWRQQAKFQLLPTLAGYVEEIRTTIGLRQQAKIPHSVALKLANCTADHRDISLFF